MLFLRRKSSSGWNSGPTEIGASFIAYIDSTFQYFQDLLNQQSSKSGILLTVKYYVENLKCFPHPSILPWIFLVRRNSVLLIKQQIKKVGFCAVRKGHKACLRSIQVT